MDNKVLEEIEQAILEEQEAELKKSKPDVAEVADYPTYLDNNSVTMPLSSFIGLYDSAKALTKLIELVINTTKITYDKDKLMVDGYESNKLMDFVKELEPLKYVERYEELLEEEEKEA